MNYELYQEWRSKISNPDLFKTDNNSEEFNKTSDKTSSKPNKTLKRDLISIIKEFIVKEFLKGLDIKNSEDLLDEKADKLLQDLKKRLKSEKETNLLPAISALYLYKLLVYERIDEK